MNGLMKGKHAQKNWAPLVPWPQPTISRNPGGGAGGGGGSHIRTGSSRPQGEGTLRDTHPGPTPPPSPLVRTIAHGKILWSCPLCPSSVLHDPENAPCPVSIAGVYGRSTWERRGGGSRWGPSTRPSPPPKRKRNPVMGPQTSESQRLLIDGPVH